MSGHGRTDQLLSQIRIIVRMPEPDCFLRYRISAARRICRCSEPCGLKWFYCPPLGIGRPSQQRRVDLSRRNTFVGSKCALLSALLVIIVVVVVIIIESHIPLELCTQK